MYLEFTINTLPIDRLRKVVLPFNADVWVPLANNPHVLLKHPSVSSGNTGQKYFIAFHFDYLN